MWFTPSKATKPSNCCNCACECHLLRVFIVSTEFGRGQTVSELIKNVEHRVPFGVKDAVVFEPGKVNSLTLAQAPGCKMTLFSFDEGEGISTHAAPGDALAFVLEGSAEITIEGEANRVEAGSAIVMPAGAPHAVKAIEAFKMLLVVVKETAEA